MAYGRKNHVNTNPLHYNIMLLGESGIGKTTVMKEVAEKLVGEDGYLFFEFGRESGAEAIEGINYVTVKYFSDEHVTNYDDTVMDDEQLESERNRMEMMNEAFLNELVEDIIINKTTEYPNLKVVFWDTLDQIIPIVQQETLKRWNDKCRREGHPDKKALTLNGAWGSFGKGDAEAMKIMDNIIERLERVGVKTVILGHVKNRDVTDTITGETYTTITSDQQQNYFNHFKKNLHVLGVAYTDREIVKQKTGKKNIVTKQEEVKGRVKDEARKIKFRDVNFAIDSKSRLKDIVPEINLDADEFIKAVRDAIEAERKKSGRTVEETKAAEKVVSDFEESRIAKEEEKNKSKSECKDIVEKIINFFTANKTSMDKIKPVLAKCREYGYANPSEIDNIDAANAILAETLKL